MNDYVVVIGAANIDIGGSPFRELVRKDSNLGTININFGGVGRNIAHNLASLGVPVKLISCAGNDALGQDLIKYCKKAGIDTEYISISENDTSSIYLFINNKDGDMELALSHIKIENLITPEYIDSLTDIIKNAALVAADANISQAAFLRIKEICKINNKILIVDPVSQSHSIKIKGHLDGIDIFKPNKIEAEYLTDINIEDIYDYKKAALALLDQGINKVFISMGKSGMFAAEKNNICIVGRYPADVKYTTGAGDAATAALIWYYYNNRQNSDIADAAKAANAAAAITTEVKETNNPYLSSNSLAEKMKNNDVIITKL